MIYEKCREILLKECELVQNAAVIQEKITKAVANREWTVFEDNLGAMNAIESKLISMENEREKLFSVFETIVHQTNFSGNLDAKGRFYKLVSILPDDQRNDLTSIYRSLKMEAIKLRMRNDALITYLSSMKSMLNEFFDLAFPERSRKIYTNQGIHLSHDMRSMVLNTRF